eukprot:gnl/MRDRNA2_/MRDRNA2_36409_c0_seq1.p1 gnl/MRDRNA2_/MRDRNA2_36409_c0~~gnl/MRDRNA2_/MRDRNA2_36409_c0_seq1.p1  ORF type:complete len:502 (-),score=95.73 gnl/MRDRNA2_/MRDRNA2_36409_c0_seq1:41-1384(-)
MTHSIDPEGRKYNWKGNREAWSSPSDDREFERITKGFIAQADRYKSLGVALKGFQEKGEIVADNGGLHLAWDALREQSDSLSSLCKDGFDEGRRFWYSWARNWASNTNKEFIEMQVAQDVHPPADFRINGVVSNFKAWREMFDVTKRQELYLSDRNQVNVWSQDEGKVAVGAIKIKRNPVTKRGVSQPHISTDGQPNPGRPTNENGRKQQGIKKKKQESSEETTVTKKPLVREQPKQTEADASETAKESESVVVPISPQETVESSNWMRSAIFTIAFSLFQVAMTFLYQTLKKDSTAAPYDGGVHNVEMMQRGDFRYSVFDVLKAPALTIFSFICCPVRWADTMRMAGFLALWTGALIMIAFGAASTLTSGYSMGFALVMAAIYRQRLRKEFQITSGTLQTIGEDLALYMFCPCLAVVQEARQMEEAYAVGHPIKTVVLAEWKKPSA